MRRFVAFACVAALCIGAPAAAPDIAGDRLLEHIKFLSSDDLAGRANGMAGLDRAAEYVERQFRSAGLEQASGGSWTQPFEVTSGLAIGRDNALAIQSPGTTIQFEIGTSYYPVAATPGTSPDAPPTALDALPVVFAGYGLSAPNVGYDDYAGIDVSDKAVLVFTHEPQEHDSNSRLSGARPMPQTTLHAKAAAARSRGAKVLLLVTDPSHGTDDGGYRIFALDPDAESVGLPVLRLRRDEVKPLLDEWSLESVVRSIDKDLAPRSRPLPGVTVRYREQLSVNRRTVRNVVGIVRGSDPRKSGEAVVVGAHYDHVGIGGRYSAAPELTGQIHNGADDNASGTAALIEIAREAARARERFPRTLVFVAFAAEEIGLLGSDHYARHPAVPIARTIAMLNLDMVGRSNGSVDVSGLETAPSLEADLKAAVEASPGLAVRREGPGAGRSDDSSFINRRVPAINFFTGFHADYHRPSDDWERIDVDGTRRVATLALELLARIAARDTRPEFVAPR
jgi:hypothetical protein